MKYLHGRRLTLLPHEMSPFERQLSQFDKACHNYHKIKAGSALAHGETPEQKKAREQDMKSEFKHLQQERRFAEVMAVIQSGLDQYRNEFKVTRGDTRSSVMAKRGQMKNEKHHPTEDLEEFLRADGRPKPSPKHTAHHIVPGKGKTPNANLARVQLHFHGLRINDPDNGAWMLRLKEHAGHWSMPNAKTHLEIHTYNYETWVYSNIRAASNEPLMRNSLRKIRLMLETGTQPKHVTMPPVEAWDGK